jgi:serine phosphatase RsbU (regulator of sigma subunit)
MFLVDRIDEILAGSCKLSAVEIRDKLLASVDEFTIGMPQTDDQTVVVAAVV